MKIYQILISLFFLYSCNDKNISLDSTMDEIQISEIKTTTTSTIKNTSLVILGTIQDAGSPQISCKKECCKGLFEHPDASRQIISLGLIDVPNNKTYLFEASPDLSRQMKKLTQLEGQSDNEVTDGIFLTHAHIGHYTGLMYLGKEAMDAKSLPVYAMPKMQNFLSTNAPWSQLISRNNIAIQALEHEQPVTLSSNILVTPFLVPHRDEFSETVGYKIQGPNNSALFIPDIDKWEKWEKDILAEIKKVDYAFIDATFYSGAEMNNRDISQIPHPFIIESLEKFKSLNQIDKQKVIFIHFNHTNPVINPSSTEAQVVIEKGFKVAKINDIFEL